MDGCRLRPLLAIRLAIYDLHDVVRYTCCWTGTGNAHLCHLRGIDKLPICRLGMRTCWKLLSKISHVGESSYVLDEPLAKILIYLSLGEELDAWYTIFQFQSQNVI